ncbi:hypothetical protein [Microbulbifer hainanensis]|uniref:hypothetical protein n=1 Tax=Microbulbifer hainanensis TaxID=2735675 RepID=UPI00186711C2|nr:hypothetical protein [Microbulbifer hainanensis]
MKNLYFLVLVFVSLISSSAYSEELHIKSNKVDVKLLSDPDSWTYEILMNGESALKDDGQILSFMFNKSNDSYFWGDKEYLIIQITTGGSGCPAFFRILDPNKEKNSLTEEFGTCSDTPNISESENGLILSFPTREPNINRVWRYENGVLSEKST